MAKMKNTEKKHPPQKLKKGGMPSKYKSKK